MEERTETRKEECALPILSIVDVTKKSSSLKNQLYKYSIVKNDNVFNDEE